MLPLSTFYDKISKIYPQAIIKEKNSNSCLIYIDKFIVSLIFKNNKFKIKSDLNLKHPLICTLFIIGILMGIIGGLIIYIVLYLSFRKQMHKININIENILNSQ